MKEIHLKENWKIVSSANIKSIDGETISSLQFNDEEWLNAKVPSTILASLVENKIYEDPYFGTNLKEIPPAQFKVPWWYRKVFELDGNLKDTTALISLEGINYRANVWLNGDLIFDSDQVYGAYRRFQFNISDNIQTGKNCLAIEVIPPKPGEFTVGFVDWNPSPPDNNLGIFRDIKLHFNNGISINNPYVETELDINDLSKADLKISAELINHSKNKIEGVLRGSIENIEISKHVVLDPDEHKTIVFSCDEFPELSINNPKIWWPNNLGQQYLYDLNLSLISENSLIDETGTKFGIRKVEDYINNGGHRGYKINGHKVLIRGAGWTDDLFLQDSYESLETQIRFVKDMNLNCIRLEGFWGKDHKLYDLCDENGILIMVGWSCQWEHEEYLGKKVHPKYGGVIEDDEIELISQSFQDQLIWLRNHPSIFVWTVGSDMLPHPELEKKYIDTFNNYDKSRPYLNSTGGIGSEQGIVTSEEIISDISGSSRVKMLGPYAYTPPIYWYTDKNLGGAYGFNTETCPGANVPPIDSLRRFIPDENLWPVDDVWNFHCGKNYFSTIDRTQEAVAKRYGQFYSAEEFAFKAQILNYELMRPMFEAFRVNQGNATGIIQWMLNSAWPEMYWQLYDTFLRQNGAYFGAKKANQPVNLIYNYGNNSIYLVNNSLNDFKDLKAQISVFNINSQNIFTETIDVNVESEYSSSLLTLPKNLHVTPVIFLDLRLMKEGGELLADNFYWLSEKKDILDYEAEVEGWPFYTPSKQYADFTSLDQLQKLGLNVSQEYESSEERISIRLENPNDKIIFFVELLLMDKKTQEVVLPTFWSDNYISLLPLESKIINAEFSGHSPENVEISLTGFNLK